MTIPLKAMNQAISDTVTASAPESCFESLANETRVAILVALWDAYQPPIRGTALSFSDLYDRVDFDGTGNFTYHLDRLTGTFVRRTDAGYALTAVGLRTATAIVTGELVDHSQMEPTAIDARCPVCDGTLGVTYRDQLLTAACTNCPGIWQPETGQGFVFQSLVPPTGLTERQPSDAFRRAVSYDLHRFRTFLDGICPRCSGPVDRSVTHCRSHVVNGTAPCPNCRRRHACEVIAVCTCCKEYTQGPIGIAALSFPDMRAQLAEAQRLPSFESWETFHLGTDVDEWIVNRDPFHVGVTLTREEQQGSVIIDDEFEAESVDAAVSE